MVALTGAVLGVATTGYLRLQAEIRAQLPGILQARLEAALHRKVTVGAIQLTPLGVTVKGLRVLRAPGDREEPLVASRLNVGIDWWQLAVTRQWRVSGVEAIDAQFRLTQAAPGATTTPWTQQVLELSNVGIERFRLRNASLRLLPPTGPATWNATGVTGDLKLGARQFTYNVRLKRLQAPEGQLEALRVTGTGDAEGVTVKQGAATFQGAGIQASGRIKARQNAALVTLKVDRLPLARLSTRLGLPAEWAMQGSLTGTVTVDARDNALRSVQGQVDVARGSLGRGGGELPWKSAHAQVDWTPARMRLADVRVLGNDLSLTANGDVTLPSGQPFTAGAFRLDGELSASHPAAVAQVADILAFRQLLEGRWTAGSAVVRFKSHGTVGQIAKASSSGHLHVEGLSFRPVAGSEPVTVQHLDADLERNSERLAFSEVKAQTEGMTVAGEAQLTAARGPEPAEFLASGSVEVGDLKSLRMAVPQASVWRWVPATSPAASGSLRFRIGGPVGQVERLWSEGQFEVRDFQLGTHAPLPSGEVLKVPVQVARGEFRHAQQRLELEQLSLSAPGIEADGNLALDFAPAQPTLVTDLRVRAANWRDLPQIPQNALPELSDGALEGSLHVTGRLAELAQSEVSGQFQVKDALFTAVHQGAEPIPVRELAARFRWAGGASADDRTLELPEVRLDSPLLHVTAAGEARPKDDDYTLTLNVNAQASDAGELAGRFNPELRLTGGAASTQFSLSAPLRRLSEAAVEGTVALRDAELLHPVQPLGLPRLQVDNLKATVSGHAGDWQLREAVLEAPGLQARLNGRLSGGLLDTDLHLKATRWNAPEALPIAGGRIELTGKLAGELDKPEELAFNGDLLLRGAHATYRAPKLALSGGNLDATLHGEGQFTQPSRWVRSGEVMATGTEWSGYGVTSLPISRAGLRFTQDQGTLRFTDAELQAGSTRVAGTGQWSPEGYSAEITASAQELGTLGVTLPEALRVGDYSLTAALHGNAARAVTSASGRLELRDVQLAAAKLPAQSLTRVSTQFQFDGERVRLANLSGSGPAGTINGSGEWSRSKHQFSVVVAGSDPTRLGIALPEGVRLGGFRLQADLTGAGKLFVNRASGKLRLADIQFPFGPVSPHALDRVETDLRWDGKRVALSDFTAEGATGIFTGTGEIAEHRFRLDLSTPRTNPDLVRWLVPGQLQGGTLAGTLQLEGNASGQLQTARGHFKFKDGAYAAPDSMALLGGSFDVPGLSADYQWERHGEKGRVGLSHIVLETALGSGTGSLSAVDGAGTLTADLVSGDAGRVADRWPVLNAHLRGGAGVGKLQMQFDKAGVRGTLAVNARGGTLLLPGEVPEYAQQPVTTLAGTLGFEPGKLTFSDVQVRGPKANLDGSGTWIEGGEVSGTGKAWFSRSYTSQLIKPSGFGWLAKLFGLKEIKSDFTLSGTSDQVKLKAGITRGLLWKFAKGRVPKNLQKIASGQSPLWVRPLVLAEALPAVPDDKQVPTQTTGGD